MIEATSIIEKRLIAVSSNELHKLSARVKPVSSGKGFRSLFIILTLKKGSSTSSSESDRGNSSVLDTG